MQNDVKQFIKERTTDIIFIDYGDIRKEIESYIHSISKMGKEITLYSLLTRMEDLTCIESMPFDRRKHKYTLRLYYTGNKFIPVCCYYKNHLSTKAKTLLQQAVTYAVEKNNYYEIRRSK